MNVFVHQCIHAWRYLWKYRPTLPWWITTLFCMNVIHRVTGLYYARVTRMLPSLSFRKWSRSFAVTKALRCRNYTVTRVENISTETTVSSEPVAPKYRSVQDLLDSTLAIYNFPWYLSICFCYDIGHSSFD